MPPGSAASMVDFVPVGEDGRAIVEALDDPDFRIVSLTDHRGRLLHRSGDRRVQSRASGDRLRRRASSTRRRASSASLVAALKRRRDRRQMPFTVMSCDNIPGNGHVAQRRGRRARRPRRRRPRLLRSQRAVAFPNSMVDRITPATTDRERAIARRSLRHQGQLAGLLRAVPAMGARGPLPVGRPALEDVGVTFTPDVAAFELMKIRILNGGHADHRLSRRRFLDIHFVHEAMADPLVRGFLEKLRDRRDHSLRAAGAGGRLARILPARCKALRKSRRSATRSRGCASTAQTGSRNSSSPRPAIG